METAGFSVSESGGFKDSGCDEEEGMQRKV